MESARRHQFKPAGDGVRGRASGTAFRSRDVPVPAHPAERVLYVAEGTAERTGAGRQGQTELLHKAWAESGNVYGYRKLHDDLIDQGVRVCPNRVARAGTA